MLEITPCQDWFSEIEKKEKREIHISEPSPPLHSLLHALPLPYSARFIRCDFGLDYDLKKDKNARI